LDHPAHDAAPGMRYQRAMADTQTITLTDVPVALMLGVPDIERAALQEIFVSVALTLEAPSAPQRDELSATIDYDCIIRFLQVDLAADGAIHLIETVADRVGAFLFDLSARVETISVTVKKPSVLAAPAMVSVSLTRHADPARRRQGLSLAEGAR
jgi:dihydroneopterin aldolase